MKIVIRSRGFEVTQAMRANLERGLRFALGRFAARVVVVNVRLSDLNGPRGGVDKRCQIEVVLRGARDVRVEDVDGDLYVAVARVAERLGRAVARELERRRESTAPELTWGG